MCPCQSQLPRQGAPVTAQRPATTTILLPSCSLVGLGLLFLLPVFLLLLLGPARLPACCLLLLPLLLLCARTAHVGAYSVCYRRRRPVGAAGSMAHTRAARYLRKRLRNLLRRFTPCCVRSQPPDGVGPVAGQEPWEPSLREEIIASSPEKGKEQEETVDVVRDHGDREQLLAAFVANYVKEIIFNARVKLYIEDMIIKGSLAIIGRMLPANDVKVS